MRTLDDCELVAAAGAAGESLRPNGWRLGVIVFARPQERVFREIIAPSLRYFDALTLDNVDFYFVGFSSVKESSYTTETEVDLNPARFWYFSAEKFAGVQISLEGMSGGKWQYSGGTDLIVAPLQIDRRMVFVDTQKVLDIKLSTLEEYSPDGLVQILVRELRRGVDIDRVSNSRIMDAIRKGLTESLFAWAPRGISKSFNMLEPFAVRKLA